MRQRTEPPDVRTRLQRSGGILACAFCGALGGGSLVETVAVRAHRPLALPSPTDLLANPLVLAGALCGTLAALALVWIYRLYRRTPAAHDEAGDSIHIYAPALTAPAQWIPFVTVTTAEQGADSSSAEAPASHARMSRVARDARWSHRRGRGVAARSARGRPHLYHSLPS